jgi:hypothetical protein
VPGRVLLVDGDRADHLVAVEDRREHLRVDAVALDERPGRARSVVAAVVLDQDRPRPRQHGVGRRGDDGGGLLPVAHRLHARGERLGEERHGVVARPSAHRGTACAGPLTQLVGEAPQPLGHGGGAA